MPRVPLDPRATQAKSPLLETQPSPENILMAAATMDQLGRLRQPTESTPRAVSIRQGRGVPKVR